MTVASTNDVKGDAHRAETVTLLQDAAHSGHPVMYPGTREEPLHAHERTAAPDGVVRPYLGDGRPHEPARTSEGPISRVIIRAIEWLIARLGGTPRQ